MKYLMVNTDQCVILDSITKSNSHRPFFLSSGAPEYLIPLIASLVVLAAILLLILCIRGRWRDRRRAKREDRLGQQRSLRKKVITPPNKTRARNYYNHQTSSDSSTFSHATSTQSTELRNFESNRSSFLESGTTASNCSTPPILSPPLSPREEGHKDEWRRFQVQRNSTQIEIIV